MKKKDPAAGDELIPQTDRVVRMLRCLQPWLQSQRARVATFAELEMWTGTPENTIRGWFASQGNPTAGFLLSLLERTPEKARLEIVHEFCRVFPALDHPRLAGDRTIVSRLVTLLGQPRGFTYIQGGNEEARTFVITALAHSFWSLTKAPRRVMGLDAHSPDWFVPVPGVVYLNNLLRRDELVRAVEAAWPSLRDGEGPLLAFNELWSALPDLQGKISELAERCHVLVADGSSIDVRQPSRRLPARTNVITISAAVPQSGAIGIEIRAL